LAPPETKLFLHEKPKNRGSCSPHGTERWYIGPSLERYRCVKSFLPNTYSERDCNTVDFFPKKIVFPSVSTDDYLHQRLKDIMSILKDPPPSTIPSLQEGDTTATSIQQIADLLHRHAPKNEKSFLHHSLSQRFFQHPSLQMHHFRGCKRRLIHQGCKTIMKNYLLQYETFIMLSIKFHHINLLHYHQENHSK